MTRWLGSDGGRRAAVVVPLALALALACAGTSTGCGSSSGGFAPPAAATDSGSGGADTSVVDSGSAADVVSEPTPSQTRLGAPTFTPPGPALVAIGSMASINAPADLPAGGVIVYTTTGSLPTDNGTVYVGPIQLTGAAGASETVIAVAHDPSGVFADSLPGIAVYTFEAPDAPVLGIVKFSPTAGTQNNDFLIALSVSGGANICYTTALGSNAPTTPTCNMTTGACTGTSVAYAGSIKVNGSVTDATGEITVTAIACEAGSVPGAPVLQTYELVVADPTMSLGGTPVPANTGKSNIPWPTGQAGLEPSVGTITSDSIEITDPVAISYSTTLGTVTCSTGLQGPNPTSFNGTEGPIMTGNTTYSVIACKQGYAPSNVVTFPLTVQLNAPALASATTPYNYELDMVAVPGGAGTDINDSANDTAVGTTTPPSGEIICATTDGTPPGCSVTNSAAICTGTSTSTPTVRATGTTVSAVACAPGLVTSQPTTATYTLQLAPPFLASSESTGSGLGKPGWFWATTGQPVLTMGIPTGAKTPYPYTDGKTWQVNQVQALPCTGTANAPEPGSSYPPPSGCTGPTYFAADYYCWSLTTTPGCGTSGTCTLGSLQAATASTTLLPSGAGVTATSTLQIIACDNDSMGEDVFLPSAVTKITF
ncbi:MAG: chitobiase/beta-hexosaminidase C-terminal domain-containing protein [Polyangiaceae bacterium]